MAQELNYSLINNILIIKNLNSPLTDELINVIKKHKSIKFVGENFNFTLDNLPEGLESLKLNYGFNQPINNLPKSLKNLECGVSFNQPIDNLPENLESLSFLNGDFNQEINLLPIGLKKLRITTFTKKSQKSQVEKKQLKDNLF